MSDPTFIFVDLAGYTAMTERHGDEYAADVAAGFAAAVRETLRGYGAREVKTLGDAVLIQADDAEEALRLAARLVCDFGARDRELGIRVGMATGPAVQREGDWFGNAVNLASRVVGLARPGEVLLAEGTRAAVVDVVLPGQLLPRGRQRLKNLADPVELYALVPAATEGDRPMPTDPVCRMTVDPRRSDHAIVHRGVEYHFCSGGCAEAFRAQPTRYVRATPDRRAGLRVSDEARERAAGRLARAYERGRLTREELEERSAAVWRAQTQADLRTLTHDLPRSRRRRPPLWVYGPLAPIVLLLRLAARRRRRRREIAGQGQPQLPPPEE